MALPLVDCSCDIFTMLKANYPVVASCQILGQIASNKSFKKDVQVLAAQYTRIHLSPKNKNLCIFTLHTYTVTFSGCLII